MIMLIRVINITNYNDTSTIAPIATWSMLLSSTAGCVDYGLFVTPVK